MATTKGSRGAGVIFGGGSQSERHVLQYLDENSAESERDELSETRVGNGADDHFLIAVVEHLLNLYADNVGVRGIGADTFNDRVVARADFGCIAESH